MPIQKQFEELHKAINFKEQADELIARLSGVAQESIGDVREVASKLEFVAKKAATIAAAHVVEAVEKEIEDDEQTYESILLAAKNAYEEVRGEK